MAGTGPRDRLLPVPTRPFDTRNATEIVDSAVAMRPDEPPPRQDGIGLTPVRVVGVPTGRRVKVTLVATVLLGRPVALDTGTRPVGPTLPPQTARAVTPVGAVLLVLVVDATETQPVEGPRPRPRPAGRPRHTPKRNRVAGTPQTGPRLGVSQGRVRLRAGTWP